MENSPHPIYSFTRLIIALLFSLLSFVYFNIHLMAQERYEINILYDNQSKNISELYISNLEVYISQNRELKDTIKLNLIQYENLDSEFQNSRGIVVSDLQDIIELNIDASPFFNSLNIPIFSHFGTNTAISIQNGPIGKLALQALSKQDVLGIDYINGGASLLITNRTIEKVGDLFGARIGIGLNRAPSGYWEVFGASSQVALPQNENIYAALQSGTFDSAELFPNWANIDSAFTFVNSFSDYNAYPGGRRQIAAISVHRDYWDGLPFLVRAPLAKILKQSATDVNNMIVSNELKVTSELTKTGFSNEQSLDFANIWLNNLDDVSREIAEGAIEYIGETKLDEKKDNASRSPKKIGYITNRRISGSNNPEYFYDDYRGDDLNCGRLFEIANNKIEIESRILSGINECLDFGNNYINSENTIFYIHGYNTSFYEAAENAAFIQRHNPDVAVILWSWPSRGELKDYIYDSKSVGKVNLHSFVSRTFLQKSDVSDKNTTILIHSLGNELFLNAAYQISQNTNIEKYGIVMAAPDVYIEDFKSFKSYVDNISIWINIYMCQYDEPLKWSRKFHGGNRVGLGGLENRISDEKTYSIEYGGRTFSLNHDYIFTVEDVYSDFSKIIHGMSNAESRNLMKDEDRNRKNIL